MNLYEAVGGEATLVALTDAFYNQVAADPLLRPLFPVNMEPGKRRLANN
jgi:hemoglobin